MVTYGNGDYVMRYMIQQQKTIHDNKIHNFVDYVNLWRKWKQKQLFPLLPKIEMLPSFENLLSIYSAFCVPSGKEIRKIYIDKST